MAEALQMYEQSSGDSSVRVGIPHRLVSIPPGTDADTVIPVSLNTFLLTHSSFLNCFGLQSAASFPSYEQDRPFSELAQKIQMEQSEMAKTCLGKEFFQSHKRPRLCAARGLIFLKDISRAQFYEKVRGLRKATENR